MVWRHLGNKYIYTECNEGSSLEDFSIGIYSVYNTVLVTYDFFLYFMPMA